MQLLIATPSIENQRRLAGIARALGTGQPLFATTWDQVMALLSSECIIALVDAELVDEDLYGRIREMHRVCPELKVARLCGSHDDVLQIEALAAGAVGCIQWSQSDDMIVRAIQVLERGEAWLERHLVPKLIRQLSTLRNAVDQPEALDDASSLDFSLLTDRERDVLHLLASGSSNKLIARKLNITDRTVKAHLTSIFKKLGVSDRVHLILHLKQGVWGQVS